MAKVLKLNTKQINPPLNTWEPESPEDLWYIYDGENVVAKYDEKIGKIKEATTLPIFFIKKNHYKNRMGDIVKHMNYFTKYYDLDRETYFAILTTKYYLDTHIDMPQKDFIELVLNRVISFNFIAKCKMMSCDLYTLNINDESSTKYNNTPKITNAQALQIVAVSFCFKIIIPLMLHFTNINTNFNPKIKTEYIQWFDRLFNMAIKKFEINDTPFYTSLCKFVIFRGEKMYRNNQVAFYQKKMLRGDTLEIYNDILMREVVCVKTLYKLDYTKSCVAFIDGVIHKFNMNYLKENFVSKPYEIDSKETSKDNDDSLSRAEAIEMATYKRDESLSMISDVNIKYVMDQLKHWYSGFDISEDEFDFYYNNFHINEISQFLFDNFYAEKFKDPYAVSQLNKNDTVYLVICMKKIFQLYKMYHLAQLCTARLYLKYKENIIKNSKFLESLTASKIYKDIISKKYSNLMELDLKENPIIKPLASMINGAYELVDYDPRINGYRLEHIDQKMISNDYMLFLSII